MRAIVDFRASHESVDALRNMDFEVIKTPRLKNVYSAICGHPDIMLHKLTKNCIITEPSMLEYFRNIFVDIKVISGSILQSEYPFDIAYNIARAGKYAFLNEKYADKTILQYFYDNGIETINIKQGYAKCSICVVSENAIITSDKGIAKTAEKNNFDVLAVNDSRIILNGFDHGFIGGATGLLNKNTLAVNGNIEMHADCNRIIDFCESHNVKTISLNNSAIEDIGSIIVV